MQPPGPPPPERPDPRYGYQPLPVERPNQHLEFVAPINVSPIALVAGYLGLGSLLCLPAPIALALGILALRDLARTPNRTGKGRAWFAIVAGGIGTVFLVVGLVRRLLE